MKSWSYIITIPLAFTVTVAFWVYLIKTINSGEFDAWPAWLIGGLACHAGLIGIIYHAYRTLTGTLPKSTRGKRKKKK